MFLDICYLHIYLHSILGHLMRQLILNDYSDECMMEDSLHHTKRVNSYTLSTSLNQQIEYEACIHVKIFKFNLFKSIRCFSF